VKTQCKEEDLSKYTVKLVCVDAAGQRVRHIFGHGSFDAEEQFDTLIQCEQCLADKEDLVLPVEVKASKPLEGQDALKALRAEVKVVEAFMMNTSAQIKKLNDKVFSSDWEPPCNQQDMNCGSVALNAAKQALQPWAGDPRARQRRATTVAIAKQGGAAAKSLLHHEVLHHRRVPLREEVQARKVIEKAAKRERAHSADEAELDASGTVADESLASELGASEARDETYSTGLPGTEQMSLADTKGLAEEPSIKAMSPVPAATGSRLSLRRPPQTHH